MLRPYQTEAIQKLKASFLKGNRRVILTLATGAGKSVIARAIVEMAKAKNNKVLFVAHRTILVDQMRRTFSGLDNVTVVELDKEQFVRVPLEARRLDVDLDNLTLA